MLTTPKSFDCVEMKRQAQENLHAEYDSRKNEFPSFYAFLDVKSRERTERQEFWAKVAETQPQGKK